MYSTTRTSRLPPRRLTTQPSVCSALRKPQRMQETAPGNLLCASSSSVVAWHLKSIVLDSPFPFHDKKYFLDTKADPEYPTAEFCPSLASAHDRKELLSIGPRNPHPGHRATCQRQPGANQHDNSKSKYKSFPDRFADGRSHAGGEAGGNRQPGQFDRICLNLLQNGSR